jgi:hypothetical protein
MSRTTALVLVAVAAGVAGFAFTATANRLDDDDPAAGPIVAASPQRARLGWRETYGTATQQLVFSVESLQVMASGWQAHVSLENDTSVPYEVGDPKSSVGQSFGLMLFSTGDQEELERKNEDGSLPAVRHAVAYEPSLPRVLEPGRSWSGTISAPGALVADGWVRVVFGPLVSVGEPPATLSDYVVWITDRAYLLRQ